MAKSRNDILWRFLADTKSLDKGNKKAQSGFKATSKAGDAMSGALGLASKAAGALGVALGAREILNFAGDAIQLAVAADEVDSKFQAVFGITEQFEQALSEWADMAGITDTAARDLAATFGNLAIAQGISAGETEDLALDVATLAGDMASFNDSDPEAVFEDLNKAILTTEREGMKKYGIAVTETEVKQRALEIAMADGRDEFTQADKSLASYEIIMRQAGKATGDLAKTQDSLANRQRRVKAEWKETQEELGRKLVPVYEDVLKLTEDMLPALDFVVGAVGEYTNAVGGLSDAMGILGGNGSGSMGDGIYGMLSYGNTILRNVVPPVAALNAGLRRMGIELLPEVTEEADNASYSLREFRNLDLSGNVGLGGVTEEARLLAEALALAAGNAGWLSREITQIPSIEDLEPTPSRPGGGGGTATAAAGGPISGTTLVGEAGPELFTPNRAGTITPNHQLGGGGGVVVNFNGVVGDPIAVAQQIEDLLQLSNRNGR